jgi:hypothetical protein
MALSKMAERVPLSCMLFGWPLPLLSVLNIIFSDRYHRMLDACIPEVCGPAAVHSSPAGGRPVSAVADQPLLASVSQMSANQPDMAYFLKINNLDPQP